MSAGTSTSPRLHVPEEPTVAQVRWRDAVLAGAEIVDVITGPGGPSRWLWSRWRALATAGWAEDDLVGLCAAYRRELWLWLMGERTWEQACSGLIGRIERRSPT